MLARRRLPPWLTRRAPTRPHRRSSGSRAPPPASPRSRGPPPSPTPSGPPCRRSCCRRSPRPSS
eukprot:863042-Pyramimonas_sp.AAC.1